MERELKEGQLRSASLDAIALFFDEVHSPLLYESLCKSVLKKMSHNNVLIVLKLRSNFTRF